MIVTPADTKGDLGLLINFFNSQLLIF